MNRFDLVYIFSSYINNKGAEDASQLGEHILQATANNNSMDMSEKQRDTLKVPWHKERHSK